MRDDMDLEWLDQAVGERLERVVVAHHRRRLRRIGKLGALDTPAGGWAAAPPPRTGTRFELHVDGPVAFAAARRGDPRRAPARLPRGLALHAGYGARRHDAAGAARRGG